MGCDSADIKRHSANDHAGAPLADRAISILPPRPAGFCQRNGAGGDPRRVRAYCPAAVAFAVGGAGSRSGGADRALRSASLSGPSTGRVIDLAGAKRSLLARRHVWRPARSILLARLLMEHTSRRVIRVVVLTLILVVTMTFPDFMNNAATAAVMCHRLWRGQPTRVQTRC